MPIRVRSTRAAAPAKPTVGAPPFSLPAAPPGWPQKPPGISLCMIVKDEERFLEQCLRSAAPIVDEMIVVDTGSTDRTIEIAKSFGARVEQREWRNDFSWARNEALAFATKRWILQLDADEELLPESFAALAQLKTAPAHLTGVWIRCVNATDRYRGGGTLSHAIVRIFPNHERVKFHGAIHEFPSVDDEPLAMPAVVAPVKIVHHGYLAEVVADRNKYARNLRIVEESLTEHPEDAFHWYNLGMTTFLGGEYERAAEAFTTMWDLCLKHGMRAFAANGLQILADTYSEHLNRPEEGLKWALECVQRSPRYANAHFSAGKAYLLLKRYDEAREMYMKAIEDGKFMDRQFVVDDEVPAWKAQCEIGSSYVEQGNHEKAVEWFERGLANRPAIQPLRVNHAKALETLGRLSEAERRYRSLYEDFGDELSAVNLVNFLLRHRKAQEALTVIERSYGKYSASAGVSMLLAAAVVQQRNGWGDGRRFLLEAARIEPENATVKAALEAIERSLIFDAQAHADAAQSALAAGDFQRVLTLAREGIAAGPADRRFAYFAAIACANLGRKEEALAFLEPANPADSEIAQMLAGTLLRELGRHEDAVMRYGRVLERNRANLDALLLQAASFEALGRMDDAESVLRRALPLSKTRVAVDLAGLYLRNGRADDARRIADEALTSETV